MSSQFVGKPLGFSEAHAVTDCRGLGRLDDDALSVTPDGEDRRNVQVHHGRVSIEAAGEVSQSARYGRSLRSWNEDVLVAKLDLKIVAELRHGARTNAELVLESEINLCGEECAGRNSKVTSDVARAVGVNGRQGDGGMSRQGPSPNDNAIAYHGKRVIQTKIGNMLLYA